MKLDPNALLVTSFAPMSEPADGGDEALGTYKPIACGETRYHTCTQARDCPWPESHWGCDPTV